MLGTILSASLISSNQITSPQQSDELCSPDDRMSLLVRGPHVKNHCTLFSTHRPTQVCGDIIPFKTHCTSIWEKKLHVYSNTHTQCVYICVCLCVCLLYIDPFSLFQETHILSADPKGSLICSGYPHPLVLATLKCGLRSPGFLLTVIIFSQNFYVWLCILPWFLFPTF